ncbi:MAG: hypothetical protein A2W91_04605 [Bacteroidetes bacterium GWF2_38_335]|nr:MAG: hypothetical protein A2W91_04605 [Bacteroidetes bacterium GWF2_38_335]HBS88212.1 DUF4919 domain-containing protein [Bacteroidales bacterium]
MKRVITILSLIFVLFEANSQEKEFRSPDYDSISIVIADTSSACFYPKLLLRLEQWDTTLTTEDYRILYYGFTYKPEYQPYWRSPYDDEMREYYQSKKLSDKDCDKVIELISKSLKENPFDLRQLNFLAYAYKLKEDEITSGKVISRFFGIISAIRSTGNGETCETGYHVISTSHEYVFLNLFEFQFVSQALTADLCDFMQVKIDERGIDGVYFQISRLWNVNIERMKSLRK